MRALPTWAAGTPTGDGSTARRRAGAPADTPPLVPQGAGGAWAGWSWPARPRRDRRSIEVTSSAPPANPTAAATVVPTTQAVTPSTTASHSTAWLEVV